MKQIGLVALIILLLSVGSCEKTYRQVEIKFLEGHSLFPPQVKIKKDFGEKLKIGDTVWVCCNDGRNWRVVEYRSFLVNARGKVVVKDGRHYSRAIIIAKLD